MQLQAHQNHSSARGQLKQLQRGVDVVVGTPGRLLDHLKRGTLDLSELKTVVLDEADEMLRMGFIDDVENILSHADESTQTVLFSATLPQAIVRVSQKFLTNPEHVKIASASATVDTIDQQYWLLNNNQKLDALTRLLEVEEFDGVIIFTRTRGTTVELAEKISRLGSAPLKKAAMVFLASSMILPVSMERSYPDLPGLTPFFR